MTDWIIPQSVLGMKLAKMELKGIQEERQRILKLIDEKIQKEKELYKATKLSEYEFAIIVLEELKQKMKEEK